ncbi:protoporphyrinogen oxidase [Candidatus Poribacteria bacterium]|nr:protoporphyrinogen oxidase [Candidatus Poribacteria bacterium]MYH83017.1 protoporphyrinogen oxidase [Candidatus Poribacteria bacterium]MYK92750.1 protoporphyrinogen oxidase [Candidatus Poribacteria bacterium]
MSMESRNSRRAIVIGGGITGLAASYRLQQEGVLRNIPLDVTLLEATGRVGGVIQTEHRDGFLIEHGPDAFISTKPAAKTLCEELDIADQFIGTNPKVRRSFVVRKGTLHPVPEGFYMMAPGALKPFLKTPLFSWRGKLRMALDLFIPRRERDIDEAVAHFVRRRLGTEAFTRMAQPMIGGIYTSDAENLSLKATFPRFLEMEKTHGSIIKALRAQKKQATETSRDTSGPRYSLFLSFKSGMQTLIDTLVDILSESIRLNTRVEHIQQDVDGTGWRVTLSTGETLNSELLCIALPAVQTSALVQRISNPLATKLNEIPYASSATVNLAFRRTDIIHPLDGMGFVVPATESLSLIGCSFSSVKFENRAPEEHVLLRAFVGEPISKNAETDLIQLCQADLMPLLGIENAPLFATVRKHTQAMAQYQVGHQDVVGDIERLTRELQGLALAGNGYHGIGIPDCIRSGETAAISLLDAFCEAAHES